MANSAYNPAPTASWGLEILRSITPDHDPYTIFDIKVRINPNGEDWYEQKGRTVSYILSWFSRRGRSFPDDPDRLYYLRGWDPFPAFRKVSGC